MHSCSAPPGETEYAKNSPGKSRISAILGPKMGPIFKIRASEIFQIYGFLRSISCAEGQIDVLKDKLASHIFHSRFFDS